MEFYLYASTLPEAESEKMDLISSLAELANVTPSDQVDAQFKDKTDKVLATFILFNPNQENIDSFNSDQLPVSFREKIVNENIIANQESNFVSRTMRIDM